MFDAGIPFKIPNVSPARTRNFVSGSGGIVPQITTPCSPNLSSNSLHVGNLPVRRVSAAGDFYFPGETTPIGSVNPDLYQNEEEDDWGGSMNTSSNHIGRLYFNVEYSTEREELLVTVVKSFSKYNRNPPSTYDTFVRIYMLPDDSAFQKTKTQKKTILPTFDETFVFKLEADQVGKRQLKFVMCELDRSRKRYMTSFTLFPLKEFDTKTVLKKTWQHLKPSIMMDKFGADLQFSVCYEKNFNKLNVTILDARNVFQPSQRLGFHSDEHTHHLTCYVKVTLRKNNKNQKSRSTKPLAVMSTSLLVKFNQLLQFTVRKEGGELLNTSLFIELYVRTEKLKEELVGEICIGAVSYATGSRVEQWMSMIEQPNSQIRMWHKLDYFPPS